MRIFLILYLVLFSSAVRAASEIEVAYFDNGEYRLKIEDNEIRVIKYNGRQDVADSWTVETFKFDKECTINYGGSWMPVSFSCRKNGHTPLAGATYKLIEYGKSKSSCASDDDKGARYICTQGCNNHKVPKYLEAFDGMC